MFVSEITENCKKIDISLIIHTLLICKEFNKQTIYQLCTLYKSHQLLVHNILDIILLFYKYYIKLNRIYAKHLFRLSNILQYLANNNTSFYKYLKIN